MPDGLIVSGGGDTAVETVELYGVAGQLELLWREAAALRSELGALEAPSGLSAPIAAWRAHAELDRAVALVHQAEVQAQFFSGALARAADGYDAVESSAQRLLGGAIDSLGGLIGMLAPAFIPGIAITAASFAALSSAERNRLLSDPRVVGAVRAGVGGADDALLARAGVPAPLAGMLGENGLGLTGLPLAAGTLATIGGIFGAFSPAGVRVAGSQPLPALAAPTGFADRLSRIPNPAQQDGAQLTVETYRMPDGELRAEVYIAGTVDFDPWAEGEPWDMGSNLANAVGPGSGSYEAVLAAMREAGLDSDTPVQFTGYSQGAATAARLAASGDFDVRGLVTFGGPTGQIEVPSSVPAVIVEHTDDLVAALGGPQTNAHAVIVERYATEGMDFDGSELMPAHRVGAYGQTAHLMDDSDDARLVATGSTIAGFTGGGVLVSRTAYEVERISSSSSAVGAGCR